MQFKDVIKLHQRKYREQMRHFLLEGEHLVIEMEKTLARVPALSTSTIYVTDKYLDWPTQCVKIPITESQMSRLSETKTPQGIIACVPFFHQAIGQGGEGGAITRHLEKSIYLHEVQDPGNLGTILRTLAWFGNFRCLLSPGSVDPYHAKVLRASMGAIFHVPIECDVELTTLATRFSTMASLDLKGAPLSSSAFASYDCYLFGNEARGLPAHSSLATVDPFTIVGCGLIDSLNLAAAVNISLYEIRREC